MKKKKYLKENGECQQADRCPRQYTHVIQFGVTEEAGRAVVLVLYSRLKYIVSDGSIKGGGCIVCWPWRRRKKEGRV